jgi:hypothetical protein
MKTADIVIVLLFAVLGYMLFLRYGRQPQVVPTPPTPVQDVVVLQQPVYVVEDNYPIWNIETRPGAYWSGIRPWRFHDGPRWGAHPRWGPRWGHHWGPRP